MSAGKREFRSTVDLAAGAIIHNLPAMEQGEREWFEKGLEEGWLVFYSICSSPPGHDPRCARCRTGTYGLRVLEGVWYEEAPNATS